MPEDAQKGVLKITLTIHEVEDLLRLSNSKAAPLYLEKPPPAYVRVWKVYFSGTLEKHRSHQITITRCNSSLHKYNMITFLSFPFTQIHFFKRTEKVVFQANKRWFGTQPKVRILRNQLERCESKPEYAKIMTYEVSCVHWTRTQHLWSTL